MQIDLDRQRLCVVSPGSEVDGVDVGVTGERKDAIVNCLCRPNNGVLLRQENHKDKASKWTNHHVLPRGFIAGTERRLLLHFRGTLNVFNVGVVFLADVFHQFPRRFVSRPGLDSERLFISARIDDRDIPRQRVQVGSGESFDRM